MSIVEDTAGNIIGEVQPTDVLFGRGRGTTNHPGNRHLREMARALGPAYMDTPNDSKREFAAGIVEGVRLDGGRFLKKNRLTRNYREVDEADAISKTQQLLRDCLQQGRIPRAVQVGREQQQQQQQQPIPAIVMQVLPENQEVEVEVQHGHNGVVVEAVQRGQNGEADRYEFDELEELFEFDWNLDPVVVPDEDILGVSP